MGIEIPAYLHFGLGVLLGEMILWIACRVFNEIFNSYLYAKDMLEPPKPRDEHADAAILKSLAGSESTTRPRPAVPREKDSHAKE